MVRHAEQSISIKKKRVNWEETLYNHIQTYNCEFNETGIPKPELEYRFHPTRKWRFDLAFIKEKLAVEIEGAVLIMGRHNRGAGFVKDMEKYNEATYLGWHIARFTPADVKSGKALAYLIKYFKGEQIEIEYK